jgi:hypothetical protein
MLYACLESLTRRPQGVALEIIVVDNASTDGAPELVARDFPSVWLVRNQTNLGFSRANNQAARLARGRYLFFLNNDTVLPPCTLERLVRYLESNPDVVLLGPRMHDGAGRTRVSHRQRPTLAGYLHHTWFFRWTGLFRRAQCCFRRQAVSPTEPQAVDILMGAALLVERSRFFILGGWDEDFVFGGEDMELCHRAHQIGRVMHHPQVEITHFGRSSTKKNAEFAGNHIAVGFVRYLRKSGWSRAKVFVYKAAMTLDAPGKLLGVGLQYLYRRMRGRNCQAEKCLPVLRGLAAFLSRGLAAFWKA